MVMKWPKRVQHFRDSEQRVPLSLLCFNLLVGFYAHYMLVETFIRKK